MRQLGELDQQQHAEHFANFLITQGIPAKVDPEKGRWAVWVRDENHLDAAREHFQMFLEKPDDPQYRDATRTATKILQKKSRENEQAARRTQDARQIWNQPLSKRAPLMMVLLSLCVGLALFSGSLLGADSGQTSMSIVNRSLAFCDPAHSFEPAWQASRDGFVDIRQGELWRIITPAFLHGDATHLIFNMIWLYQLGGLLEVRKGPLLLAVLVLLTAITGNLGQFFMQGPRFLGMSGVVYGLLGFIGIRGHLFPKEQLDISQQTITIMLAWLVLGFSGALETMFGLNVANWAHLFGLLGGIALAFLWPIKSK